MLLNLNAPESRDKGTGLGMSICKEIAQAHGLTLTASRAEPGLRVVFERPPQKPGK